MTGTEAAIVVAAIIFVAAYHAYFLYKVRKHPQRTVLGKAELLCSA